MGRRSQVPELAFGSDSFLDVICNIVGILIILIVIVSVKVERQPTGQPAPTADAVVDPSVPDAQPAIPDREAEYTQSQSELEELNQKYRALLQRRKELAERRASLQQEYRLVQEEIEALHEQLAEQEAASKQIQVAQSAAETETRKLANEVDRLLRMLKDKEKSLSSAVMVAEQEAAAAAAAEEKLKLTIVETVRLREVLDSAGKPAVPTSRLVHRILPVSRRTDGEEVMFRLADGKVSEVPLQELMKLAVDRVRKRVAMLQRFGRLDDVIGPLGGYKMLFTIEMNAFNSLEYLQYGGDGNRFTALKQVIVPDESLVAEPVAFAIQPGSAFRQKLESMPVDSAMTIFVYDDSFQDFAALREVAHGLQIRVAARPLPKSADITISAQGSASRAQ